MPRARLETGPTWHFQGGGGVLTVVPHLSPEDSVPKLRKTRRRPLAEQLQLELFPHKDNVPKLRKTRRRPLAEPLQLELFPHKDEETP